MKRVRCAAESICDAEREEAMRTNQKWLTLKGDIAKRLKAVEIHLDTQYELHRERDGPTRAVAPRGDPRRPPKRLDDAKDAEADVTIEMIDLMPDDEWNAMLDNAIIDRDARRRNKAISDRLNELGDECSIEEASNSPTTRPRSASSARRTTRRLATSAPGSRPRSNGNASASRPNSRRASTAASNGAGSSRRGTTNTSRTTLPTWTPRRSRPWEQKATDAKAERMPRRPESWEEQDRQEAQRQAQERDDEVRRQEEARDSRGNARKASARSGSGVRMGAIRPRRHAEHAQHRRPPTSCARCATIVERARMACWTCASG